MENVARAASHNMIILTAVAKPSVAGDTSATAAEQDNTPPSVGQQLHESGLLQPSRSQASLDLAQDVDERKVTNRMFQFRFC